MDNHSLNSKSGNTVLFKCLGIVLRFLGFYFLGGAITIVLFTLLLGSEDKVLNLISGFDNSSSAKFLLLSMQGLTHLIGFIILPLLYVHFFDKSLFPKFKITFTSKNFSIYFLLAILIMISAIPLVTWIIHLNKSINLPEFMDSLERSMEASELKAKRLTDIIAYYSNTKELLFSLLIIAVLPAIGEELLFRGIMQNEFSSVLKNPHLAIWITGFIFSFIHFQFYGFFPRMLLGVIFGYLYFWSGNIIIPIVVHFLNNALTLITMNLYKQKVITMDPDSSESFPFISIIISLLVFSILLFTFKRLKNNKDHQIEHS